MERDEKKTLTKKLVSFCVIAEWLLATNSAVERFCAPNQILIIAGCFYFSEQAESVCVIEKIKVITGSISMKERRCVYHTIYLSHFPHSRRHDIQKAAIPLNARHVLCSAQLSPVG
jgi:hypothetical protein